MRKVMTQRINHLFELADYKEAYFHTFGLQTNESGAPETIAIVEYIDTNKVDTYYPYRIRFLDKPETN